MPGQKDEILYLWIGKTEYNCFEDNEFNFSINYFFHYDFKNNTLSCNVDKKLNVFSDLDNISNVTAIVGNNGAGKSTLLKYLLQLNRFFTTSNYYSKKQNPFILIRRKLDELIILTSDNLNPSVSFSVDNLYIKIIEGVDAMRSLNDLTFIYVSLEEQTNKSFDVGKSKRFIALTPKQIQSDATTFKFSKDCKYIKQYRVGSFFKNQFEILILVDFYSSVFRDRILLNEDSEIMVSVRSELDLFLSRYVNECQGLFSEKINRNLVRDIYSSLDPDSILLTNIICQMIINGFDINFSYSLLQMTYSEIRDEIIYHLNKLSQKKVEVVNYFKDALAEVDFFHECKKSVFSKTNYNDSILKYAVFNFENIQKIIKLILTSENSFLYRYLIFEFEKSDGEMAYLKHLAYLYYISHVIAYFKKEKYELNDNIVILLDEVDVHLHPEWQRQLINNTLDSLNYIFPYKNIQILFTTHSPIILSDIPSQNVLYIKKDKNLKRKVFKRLDICTFGANIFDLYNDSFFFENNALIGDFSKKYVNELFEKVKANKNEDNKLLKNQINLIGEPILKNQLLTFLKENSYEFNEKKDALSNEELIDILNKEKEKIEQTIEQIKRSKND